MTRRLTSPSKQTNDGYPKIPPAKINRGIKFVGFAVMSVVFQFILMCCFVAVNLFVRG